MDFSETKYYGDVGFLYPYDIRYSSEDRAFCNPQVGGWVLLRLQTEHALSEAVLVYNDGVTHGAAMEETARDSRFRYWEVRIRPDRPQFRYSFAFKATSGAIIYFCKHGIDHAVEPLDRWELDLEDPRNAPLRPPAWMRGAVVYQIFPDRFANGNPGNDPTGSVAWGSLPDWLEFQGGDLEGVIQRLDYLQELGVNVLYLNPIFLSPSTHKYDAVDYYQVDPALGGNKALQELVNALHRRKMRVVLDASFNHCHPRFFAFQDIVKKGPDSPFYDWFTIYEYPIRVRYRPHLVEGRYADYLARFPQVSGIPLEAVDDDNGPRVEPSYLAWYGVLDMPKLNLRNPQTRAYFLDVTAHWLREFNIDGWRMDVARHIEADFWQDFRRVAKLVRPDCYLLAEIWGNTAPWLQGDQFDATMNYIFHDLCVGYFARAQMGTQELTDGITRMLALYAPEVTAVTHNLLSSHDVERFRFLAGERIERLRLATLFLLTMPGAPGIYYGDEIGLSGGHDPDCRRAFPWEQQAAWDSATLAQVRELTAVRRDHPALREGDWKLVWQGAEAFAFRRQVPGDRLLIVINRGPAIPAMSLPLFSEAPSVLWGQVQVEADVDQVVVRGLPAWNGAVIQL